MKEGIHPEYREVVFQDVTSDGFKFLTRSTLAASAKETIQWEDGNEYPLIKVEISSASHPFFTGKQKLTMLVFFGTFLLMIYAVVPWSDLGIDLLPTFGWWFDELSTLFFSASILIALINRMPESNYVATFLNGARDLIGVALVVAALVVAAPQAQALHREPAPQHQQHPIGLPVNMRLNQRCKTSARRHAPAPIHSVVRPIRIKPARRCMKSCGSAPGAIEPICGTKNCLIWIRPTTVHWLILTC